MIPPKNSFHAEFVGVILFVQITLHLKTYGWKPPKLVHGFSKTGMSCSQGCIMFLKIQVPSSTLPG